MAYDMTVGKHAVFFPSKIAASAGSPHIYNIVVTDDTDNGVLCGRGDYVSFDQYEQDDAPAGFAGVIREAAADGWGYYVEVTELGGETLVIYDSEILPRADRDLSQLSMFYNEDGATVKAYTLIVGDVFELSAEGFTNNPVVGNTVTIDSTTGKLTVGA